MPWCIAAMEAAEMSCHGQAECQGAEPERDGIPRVSQVQISDTAKETCAEHANLSHSIVNRVAVSLPGRGSANAFIDDTISDTGKIRRQLSALDRLHRRINLRSR